MNNLLERIVADKRLEIEQLKLDRPLGLWPVTERLSATLPAHSFRKALENDDQISIIAEIKRASPSRGVIRESFDPEMLAAHYRDGGAAAISVLTDKRYFQGSYEHLTAVRQAVDLPILFKDFVVDHFQLQLASRIGAQAVLLIAALYTSRALKDMLTAADELGLDCLVEIHDETELAKALEANAILIGVNNRNLNDFSVSLETSLSLAKRIPEGVIAVSESGINNPADIRMLRDAGYNSFLIGEALVCAADPVTLLAQLRLS